MLKIPGVQSILWSFHEPVQTPSFVHTKQWVIVLVCLVIYNLFFHPLSKYPGPFFAAASRLWWTKRSIRGTLFLDLCHEHERYGPVIRIAPDELSFISPQAFRDIYGWKLGQREKLKDPREGFSPVPNVLFSDTAKHSQIRRRLAHAFSDKSRREQEPVLMYYVDLLLDRVGSQCKEGEGVVDLDQWYNYTTFDITGRLTFNESFGCLQNAAYHPLIESMFDRVKDATYIKASNRIPGLTWLLLRLFPPSVKRKSMEYQEMMGQKVVKRKVNPPKYIDYMTYLLKGSLEGMFSEKELTSNGDVIIVAGSETTATLLSGVTYYLLMHPDKLEKLVREIRSAFDSAEAITCQSVTSLHYLRACLNESLRLYPPSPGCHQRIIPPEGATVVGEFLPSGTTVGVATIAAFSSSQNFSDPLKFVPERWLGQMDYRSDRTEAFQPFSYGPRNCIGKNFAYTEISLIMTKLLWTFDLEATLSIKNWRNQKIFTLWQKSPLNVKVKLRHV